MNILSELKSGRLFHGENNLKYNVFNGFAYSESIDEESDTLKVICRRGSDTWTEYWRLSEALRYFELGMYKFI